MIDSFLFQHRTRGRHDPTNPNRHTDVFAQTHQSTVRQDRRHERCLRLFAGNLADGVYSRRNIHEIRGSGYVVESLEAALWCFLHTDSFRDAILCATNSVSEHINELADWQFAYTARASVTLSLVAGVCRILMVK